MTPSDRLLITQAMTEQIPLLSKDASFEPYEIEVICISSILDNTPNIPV